jgi:S-formylglutathione hydrolase
MSFKTTATIASFGGKLLKLTHDASTTGCEMALNLYLPPNPAAKKLPVLFYLSGLTCTGDNCAEKGFFQQAASQNGIAIVYPDTSPSTCPYHATLSTPNTSLMEYLRGSQNPR